MGLQTQGGAAALGGLFILTEGAMGLGKVGVKGGRVGAENHRSADQLDGPGEVAALMVHDAEEVERVVRDAEAVAAAKGPKLTPP